MYFFLKQRRKGVVHTAIVWINAELHHYNLQKVKEKHQISKKVFSPFNYICCHGAEVDA